MPPDTSPQKFKRENGHPVCQAAGGQGMAHQVIDRDSACRHPVPGLGGGQFPPSRRRSARAGGGGDAVQFRQSDAASFRARAMIWSNIQVRRATRSLAHPAIGGMGVRLAVQTLDRISPGPGARRAPPRLRFRRNWFDAQKRERLERGRLTWHGPALRPNSLQQKSSSHAYSCGPDRSQTAWKSQPSLPLRPSGVLAPLLERASTPAAFGRSGRLDDVQAILATPAPTAFVPSRHARRGATFRFTRGPQTAQEARSSGFQMSATPMAMPKHWPKPPWLGFAQGVLLHVCAQDAPGSLAQSWGGGFYPCAAVRFTPLETGTPVAG